MTTKVTSKETLTSVSSLDHAWRTATKRSKLSRPARLLSEKGYLGGRCADFGCGRGDDARELGIDGYDPHFAPERLSGPYDALMCNYVLNVIEDAAVRRNVLRELADLLDEDGTAYISVRANRADLKGLTRTGSWQGLITLDLPIVFKNADSITYAMGKTDANCKMTAKTF